MNDDMLRLARPKLSFEATNYNHSDLYFKQGYTYVKSRMLASSKLSYGRKSSIF
jgi:hypothetical protein